jgi:transposase-like protein
MHYSQSDKYEIIQLVEQSDLGINRTLKELKINKKTFYNWCNLYTQKGFEGLARRKSERVGTWNKINIVDRDKVVEITLKKPKLSSREVAWHITDNYNYYISESSV